MLPPFYLTARQLQVSCAENLLNGFSAQVLRKDRVVDVTDTVS